MCAAATQACEPSNAQHAKQTYALRLDDLAAKSAQAKKMGSSKDALAYAAACRSK